jgi:hypothetical protein
MGITQQLVRPSQGLSVPLLSFETELMIAGYIRKAGQADGLNGMESRAVEVVSVDAHKKVGVVIG